MEEITKQRAPARIKTGIYSGSFNPIHIGHLALANWLCEFGGLDEVWFMVSPHNPLKAKESLMDDRLRLEMAKAATGNYPKFSVSDFEFSLPTPSYTIDTLHALRTTYPERDFHLVIGADNWQQIDQWKEHEKLREQYPILIYPRKGYQTTIPKTSPTIRIVDAPLIDISSTFIREAYGSGKDVRFFLPEAIRPYFESAR